MQEKQARNLPDDTIHLEDLALKSAAQYFGEELLQYIGVKEKVQRIAPTELVHLEARKLYEDFNFEMENGMWFHFEFESDSILLKDLKRFREYEAVTSRVYSVPVVTCVVCSSTVRNILSEFTEGINTYRVRIIRIKDQSADKLFDTLKKRHTETSTIHLKREDLIPILLSPLMSGTMGIKERIVTGIKLVQQAFANKILKNTELDEVKEVIFMTRLGQMILEEGIERGMERGMERGIQQGIQILIDTCRELGVSREVTLNKVETKFSLSKEAAESYLDRYWK